MWFNHGISLLYQLSIRKFQHLNHIFTILLYFLTFWLACSGAIHLIEVTGDPWNEFNNRHSDLKFHDYIYFLIVTMSTVGYGDISPQTEAGRIFLILFIIGSLFLLGYFTPTISEILSSWSRYSGSYTKITDEKHVVVSGHITPESVRSFLRNFLHPDWNDDYTKVIILHPNDPDYELKTVLKKYNSIQYFRGSVLNTEDMTRVNMDTASAAILLCPNYSQNPDCEDESNVMRILSIKNAYNNAKIIVQVFHLQGVRKIFSIPDWNRNEDTIICKNELKLVLMAQNCLCPGISTLLSNFIYPMASSDLVANQTWQLDYCKG